VDSATVIEQPCNRYRTEPDADRDYTNTVRMHGDSALDLSRRLRRAVKPGCGLEVTCPNSVSRTLAAATTSNPFHSSVAAITARTASSMRDREPVA